MTIQSTRSLAINFETTGSSFIKKRVITKAGNIAPENCCRSFLNILGVAIFIIGCVGAAGHLNGVVLGGCTIGLAGLVALLSVPATCITLSNQTEDQQTFGRVFGTVGEIIISLGLVAVGACALTGVISPVVAGYVIIAPSIIGLTVTCCGICCCVPCVLLCLGCMAARSADEQLGNAPTPHQREEWARRFARGADDRDDRIPQGPTAATTYTVNPPNVLTHPSTEETNPPTVQTNPPTVQKKRTGDID
jgi:hypothetical protein